jgi:hypothetical protein
MNIAIEAVKRLAEGQEVSEEIQVVCRAILNIDGRLHKQFANDKDLLREIQDIRQEIRGK